MEVTPSVDTIWKYIPFGQTVSWFAPLYFKNLYGSTIFGVTTIQTGYTFDKWSLLITDTTLSEIEIGMIVLGEYVELPQMSPDQDLSQVTESKVSYSETGQVYGDLNYDYRNPSIKCPYVDQDEWDDLFDMWGVVKNVTPFTLLIWIT